MVNQLFRCMAGARAGLRVNSSLSEQSFWQVGDFFGSLQKICMCSWKCSHYFVVIAPSITKIVLLYANDNDRKKHTRHFPPQGGCRERDSFPATVPMAR